MKKHLSLDERFDIENSLCKGISFKEIGSCYGIETYKVLRDVFGNYCLYQDQYGGSIYKLDDYATNNDVSTFITQNDVSIYAVAADVDASLALKADKTELNNYAKKNDISTFITSNDISTFITENDASIYLTDEDLVGYATESFVNSSLGNYYTKSDASTLFNPYNTVTANDAGVAWFPIWNARGQIVGHNWAAFRKDLTINGVAKKVWGSV